MEIIRLGPDRNLSDNVSRLVIITEDGARLTITDERGGIQILSTGPERDVIIIKPGCANVISIHS